jgi:sugar transferase (PEP-CTERM/EpsH1 system associated)
VLHVLDHLDTGGTEFGVLKVMNGLPQERFDCRVCVMRGARPDLADSALLAGRVFYAEGAKEGSQLGIRRLAHVFRSWRPHIVHSRNWGAIEAIPAACLTRVPVTIHSEHGYELDMLRGLPFKRRLLRRGFYCLADAVFTVSRDLSSYHARQVGWETDRIATIYNGVDTGRFRFRLSQRRRIREDLGLPEPRFVIGAVGRLVAIKDYATLLRAAGELLREGHDISVLLVGGGPERVALEKVAATLGDRAVFLGERNDLPMLFNAMDAFAQTSISEGTSNTILEAMASGLPVAATRVGGNPELITHEMSGLLFPPGDLAVLAANLAQLATNPNLCQRLGEAARQRVVNEFSLDRMLTSYEALYLNLAVRRSVSLGR